MDFYGRLALHILLRREQSLVDPRIHWHKRLVPSLCLPAEQEQNRGIPEVADHQRGLHNSLANPCSDAGHRLREWTGLLGEVLHRLLPLDLLSRFHNQSRG